MVTNGFWKSTVGASLGENQGLKICFVMHFSSYKYLAREVFTLMHIKFNGE